MEIILTKKSFSIILIFQYLMFKHFLNIDFRTTNIYWDGLFTAPPEEEYYAPFTRSSTKARSSCLKSFL